MKSVAPNSMAIRSLDAIRSMAIIWEAPHRRAAWITFRPTPPAPITTTVSPSSTRARLNTAPAPVITPQPMSAAEVSGTSFGIGTAWFSWRTTWSPTAQ